MKTKISIQMVAIALLLSNCSKINSISSSDISLSNQSNQTINAGDLYKASEKGVFYFSKTVKIGTDYYIVIKTLGEPKNDFYHNGGYYLNYNKFAINFKKGNENDKKTWKVVGFMYSLDPPISISDLSKSFKTSLNVIFKEGMDTPYATYDSKKIDYTFYSNEDMDSCYAITVYKR